MSSAIVDIQRPDEVDISQTNITSPQNVRRKKKAGRQRTSGSELKGPAQNISQIVENVKAPSEATSEFTRGNNI